ncbi:MAG: NnrS family protein [Gammaproteobacteria bacterium]|nr:MAG: NnrS family protein [Gammaproteobacteria bacterium]RLA59182.1 MAG: NnrS family protein [Gammaproteobacteria bacterium]
MINIDDSRVAMTITPILRLAFRPLFLGGTIFSVIAMGWWTYFWLNPVAWTPYGGPVWWHGHEMLFGFGSAIVVGFLLTAVQAWTGVGGLRGKLLGVLAVCWLLGRLLLALGSSLPAWLVVATDLSFLLFSAAAMAYPVVKVKQWRNLMFVPMLLVLALLNGASHWGVLNKRPDLALQSLHGAIMLITLIIAVVGGRVIPFFTANATGCERLPPKRWLEVLSVATIILLAMIAFVGFSQVPEVIMVVLCVIAALTNSWRFLRWGIQYSWGVPLLWSLHLAYAFIPLGLLALALYSAGYLASASIAMHCFTAGAIGGMILAMISRVTLGHTGRPLQPPAAMVPAYILILLGAVLRVLVPAAWPQYTHWGIALAGVFWVLAYGIFCIYYSPMLLASRADGRPG